MTTNEWNELLNKITKVWEQFANAIRQAANTILELYESVTNSKEKSVKKTCNIFAYSHKKDQYLRNHTPMYKVERKAQKHLPYQRRNY